MTYVEESARKTIVRYDGDVVVCGAGPAGWSAAISAARGGARVALIEAAGAAGGIWTSGALAWIIDHEGKGGILREMRRELGEMGGLGFQSAYDIETMKVYLEREIANHHIDFQLFTRVVGVVLEESGKGSRRVTGVVTESKSGREAWLGSIIIDATGDGDVAALAGCSWEHGGPTGKGQPMSMMCLFTGPRPEEIADYVCNSEVAPGRGGPHKTAKENLARLMRETGHEPSYGAPTIWHIADDLYALMANHEYGYRGFNASDVTKATMHARSEVYEAIQKLRTVGGVWSRVRVVATAAQIGVREGRRVKGLYRLTRDDVINGRFFPDAVCTVHNWVDIHATDEDEGKGYRDDGVRGTGFQVPLRAMIAAEVDGLLLAGRCISGDFWAHAAYRVTGNAVPMGEAAGRIAADLSKGATRPSLHGIDAEDAVELTVKA
jgi:hypothetical protein